MVKDLGSEAVKCRNLGEKKKERLFGRGEIDVKGKVGEEKLDK